MAVRVVNADYAGQNADCVRLDHLVADHFQAVYIAGLLGVEIKSEHDD